MTLQVIKAEDVRDGEPRWYCADQRHADEQIRDGLDGPLHLTDRGKEWFASWPLAIVDRPAPTTQPPPVLDLDALDEAERAMTAGPWRTDSRGNPAAPVPQDRGIVHTLSEFHGDLDVSEPNARGTIALRNAAPYLIAEARAAVALRQELAAMAERLAEAKRIMKEAADLFIAIQMTDGEEEHRAIVDGAKLAAKIASEGGVTAVVTYVVRAGSDGHIKIGRTRNLAKRIEALQTGAAHPLVTLHVIAGDHERHLHIACKAFRVQGEWFTPSDEFFAALRAAIDAIPTGEG